MNARVLAVGILLTAGAITTFALAFLRPTPAAPTLDPNTSDLKYSYLMDVAGWYEITPNESAVASAYDFSIDRMKALPTKMGRWNGEPLDLGNEVDVWFENPALALSSLYRDDRGNQLWFSVFGSRSSKSYSLFEHTPSTSYPAAGWTLEQQTLRTIPIESRKISVQEAVLSKAGARRIAFYWYLWNDFSRDPEQGLMTMRLHIQVTQSDEDARRAGEDFMRALFPQVITWHRF